MENTGTVIRENGVECIRVPFGLQRMFSDQGPILSGFVDISLQGIAIHVDGYSTWGDPDDTTACVIWIENSDAGLCVDLYQDINDEYASSHTFESARIEERAVLELGEEDNYAG